MDDAPLASNARQQAVFNRENESRRKKSWEETLERANDEVACERSHAVNLVSVVKLG
ncbi:hypothetical protein GCM10017687_45040 [Streptomyces echinatus]